MDVLLAFSQSELARADLGAKAWSTAYHLTFGMAGVFGIIVGAISQASFQKWILSKETLITVLSLSAAILTFVGGFGGFEAKWQANRAYRLALQQIVLDLQMPNPDLPAIRERLRQASFDNNAIRLPTKTHENTSPPS